MNFSDDLATLSLNLDSDRGSPLYQQLAGELREMIHTGRLAPDERLPSSRKLAQLLGISRTSTLNAYDQLIAEGLLITKPASGVFITSLAKDRQPEWLPEHTQPASKTTTLPPNNYTGIL